MSAFLMNMQSLSNLGNWFYFENDMDNTFKQCKKLICEFLKVDDEYKGDWEKDFSEELYKLNCSSLNQRYYDDLKDFPEFEFKEPQNIKIIQVLKSVQCWLYQSCEGKAREKPLFKLMERIENILLNTIIDDLEEYKKAKWN